MRRPDSGADDRHARDEAADAPPEGATTFAEFHGDPANIPRPLVGSIPAFADPAWVMSFGERAAIIGILSQLRPRISIEIGVALGGSLDAVAAHSGHVHAFDLFDAPHDLPANVTYHRGDSHLLLPRILAELESAGQRIDFALVDGDHSAVGVRQDIEDILGSGAAEHAIILAHDTMNEEVRSGLDAVRYADYPNVRYVELDFLGGHMFREPSLEGQIWNGLGLIVVDASKPKYASDSPFQTIYFEAHGLMRELLASRDRPTMVPGANAHGVEVDLQAVQRQIQECRAQLQLIQDSMSWRLTEPLRAAKSLVGGPKQTERSLLESNAPAEEKTPEVRLAEAREDLQRHRGAVEASQRSLSWRVTAPLRRIKSIAVRAHLR